MPSGLSADSTKSSIPTFYLKHEAIICPGIGPDNCYSPWSNKSSLQVVLSRRTNGAYAIGLGTSSENNLKIALICADQKALQEAL